MAWFIRVRLVHSARLVIAGFIRVHVGSFWHELVWPGSIECVWAYSNAPSRHRVHSGWRMFTRALLGGAEFIRDLVDSIGAPGFIRAGLGSHSALSGRWVHSGSRGYSRAHIDVVGFIQILVGSLGRTYR